MLNSERANVLFKRLIKLPDHFARMEYAHLYGIVQDRLTDYDLDHLERGIKISEDIANRKDE